MINAQTSRNSGFDTGNTYPTTMTVNSAFIDGSMRENTGEAGYKIIDVDSAVSTPQETRGPPEKAESWTIAKLYKRQEQVLARQNGALPKGAPVLVEQKNRAVFQRANKQKIKRKDQKPHLATEAKADVEPQEFVQQLNGPSGTPSSKPLSAKAIKRAEKRRNARAEARKNASSCVYSETQTSSSPEPSLALAPKSAARFEFQTQTSRFSTVQGMMRNYKLPYHEDSWQQYSMKLELGAPPAPTTPSSSAPTAQVESIFDAIKARNTPEGKMLDDHKTVTEVANRTPQEAEDCEAKLATVTIEKAKSSNSLDECGSTSYVHGQQDFTATLLRRFLDGYQSSMFEKLSIWAKNESQYLREQGSTPTLNYSSRSRKDSPGPHIEESRPTAELTCAIIRRPTLVTEHGMLVEPASTVTDMGPLNTDSISNKAQDKALEPSEATHKPFGNALVEFTAEELGEGSNSATDDTKGSSRDGSPDLFRMMASDTNSPPVSPPNYQYIVTPGDSAELFAETDRWARLTRDGLTTAGLAHTDCALAPKAPSTASSPVQDWDFIWASQLQIGTVALTDFIETIISTGDGRFTKQNIVSAFLELCNEERESLGIVPHAVPKDINHVLANKAMMKKVKIGNIKLVDFLAMIDFNDDFATDHALTNAFRLASQKEREVLERIGSRIVC